MCRDVCKVILGRFEKDRSNQLDFKAVGRSGAHLDVIVYVVFDTVELTRVHILVVQ